MSWNFDFKVDDKAAAKVTLAERAEAAGGHFPASLLPLIEAAIDALPELDDSEISVTSFGHFTSDDYRGTSNLLIEVKSHFKAAPAEAIEQPAVAAGNGDPAGKAAQSEPAAEGDEA